MAESFSGLPGLLFISTFVSEDLAMVGGLTAVQSLKMTGMEFLVFYTLGIIIGDVGLYGLGRLMRSFPYLKRFRSSFSLERPKSQGLGSFEIFLFFTRVLPGSRVATYTYCGFTGYSLGLFALTLALSTITYALGALVLVSWLSFNPESIKWYYLLVIAVLALLVIRFTFKTLLWVIALSKRFRLRFPMLLIPWTRMRRLEFWPGYILYFPIVGIFAWFGAYYRGFRILLATNPGLYMSGILGENKSQIDRDFLSNFGSHYLKSNTSPPQTGNDKSLEEYLSEIKISFPFVVKPDSGARGWDVELVSSIEQFARAHRKMNRQYVIQEYCPWPKEWGVFYVRNMEDQKGKIFSITEKIFPRVTGDGVRTLQELVMADLELRIRYDLILSEDKQENLRIPEKGEVVNLVFRGNHSKGCIFRDGKNLLTPQIEKSITKVLDQMAGYNIGRLDIKFRNLEALANGEFKILEINGTGAESTNIYDPNFSVLEVYKILYRQIGRMFEVGYKVHQTGLKTPTLFSLFREVFAFVRT